MTPQKQKTGTVTIDGREYKTVRIGNQEWLAENLASANHTAGESWGDTAGFGRLYNHAAVMSLNLPDGWRLASDSDFQSLKDTFGDAAGNKLKSVSGWDEEGNGTNESGLNMLPGGYRGPDGNFYGRGLLGYWWCTAQDGGSRGYYWALNYNSPGLWRNVESKSLGFSVRCVRNLESERNVRRLTIRLFQLFQKKRLLKF